MVPDLVCLGGGFSERVGEDELMLERGGDGDERFVAVLPFHCVVKRTNDDTRRRRGTYQAE